MMIFTTGAFLIPIKVIRDGQEALMRIAAGFINDSFKDKKVFNPPELSETQEGLWVE